MNRVALALSVLLVWCTPAALGQIISTVVAQAAVQSDDTPTSAPRVVIQNASGPQVAQSGITGRSPISSTVTKALVRSRTSPGSASVWFQGDGSTGEAIPFPGRWGVCGANAQYPVAETTAVDWIITGPPGDPRTHVDGKINWGWVSATSASRSECDPPQACVNCEHVEAEGFIQVLGPGLAYVDDVEAVWDGRTLTSGVANATLATDRLVFPVGQRFEVHMGAKIRSGLPATWTCRYGRASGSIGSFHAVRWVRGLGLDPMPVMELPPGFTVNSVSSAIENNAYVGPELAEP